MSETIAERQPQFLDQLCRCIRDKHDTLSTERTYVYWMKWYMRVHGLHHPVDMGENEIRAFLSYLNNDRQIV
ncbi:phage integrase N-terminal SAM-like domain-containing protein [Noviherbaspirillum autotrophicum]|uniref:phage integrase N-terminal SAM-like domain-containing protein n=1 Tax=Noviherbaspirillum autotrophicum TaxID=709839 RepID=UPI000694BB0A